MSAEPRAALQGRLTEVTRHNTYDPATDTIVLDTDRAAAFEELAAYYADIYGNGRDAYAIPAGALRDPDEAARDGRVFLVDGVGGEHESSRQDVSYTQNWPHEELGRQSSDRRDHCVERDQFRAASRRHRRDGVVLRIAGHKLPRESMPRRDPLLGMQSDTFAESDGEIFLRGRRAVGGAGGAGRHRRTLRRRRRMDSTESRSRSGYPILARTWHLQIGIFWIATSWLATGLYIVPAVSGAEPKGQRLGVNLLFVAVVAVVVGSLAGEWMGIEQKLGNLWFWLGSQGYEYVDLGRLWQILLFVGFAFWLWLMWRGIKPALARRDENYSLLMLFLISSIAIPLFYAAGLMYGQRSQLITAEYWRWWVVHLWVEGFFEVFATVVIAFLLTRLRLLSITTATRGVSVLDRHLSLGRHHRDLPSPVLHRHPIRCWRWARCSARWKSSRWC